MKSSNQSQKEKRFFCEQKRRRIEASNAVVCGNTHISVYEMRKKQQTHEDATKLLRTKVVARRLQAQAGKAEQLTFGRIRLGERSGSKRRGVILVSKVFGLCAAKTGTNIDESMRARENGH